MEPADEERDRDSETFATNLKREQHSARELQQQLDSAKNVVVTLRQKMVDMADPNREHVELNDPDAPLEQVLQAILAEVGFHSTTMGSQVKKIAELDEDLKTAKNEAHRLQQRLDEAGQSIDDFSQKLVDTELLDNNDELSGEKDTMPRKLEIALSRLKTQASKTSTEVGQSQKPISDTATEKAKLERTIRNDNSLPDSQD